MLAVIFYFCCAGLLLTISIAGTIFVALLSGDIAIAQRLSVYLLLGIFLFAGPVLAIIGRQGRVPQIGSLFLVVLVWGVLPVMAAVPIIDISDLGVVDALFESVSGLTTTGASTLTTLEAWPQSLIFWRVQLQWLGGVLALLTIFVVIAPMGIGGLSLTNLSASQSAGVMASRGRMYNLMFNFGIFYLAMTALAFLLLLFTGVRSFHAATLAMTAVSTGGFLPFDSSLDEVLGPGGILIFGLFLLFGATSVMWHRMVLRWQWTRLRDHRESYSVIALTLVLGFAFTLTLISVSGGGAGQAGRSLIEGFMNAASLVATSGVESRPGVFSLFPLAIILFVILLGGSAFSTSGGLKHYRIGGMLVQSWSELDRLVYPSAVRPSRFGTQHYDLQLMKAIWSFFVVAILTISIGTVLVAGAGAPFEAALTATISAFATAGPVYNSGWAPPGTEAWPPYGAFADSGKIALMVVMLLGRLEVLAVIGLFTASYWRNR